MYFHAPICSRTKVQISLKNDIDIVWNALSYRAVAYVAVCSAPAIIRSYKSRNTLVEK